jgi:hypothetical protein
VVGAAKCVGDPVLAAMADEQDPALVELLAAVRTAAEALIRIVGLEDCPGIPVGALDDPRDDVLEAAEDRLSLADRLGRAKALAIADVDATPAALTFAHTSANRLREGPGGSLGRYRPPRCPTA